MKSPLQLFVAIAVLLATATVAAQVYRWVDKDGKVHFSDTPPPTDSKGTAAKKVDVRPASGAAAPPQKARRVVLVKTLPTTAKTAKTAKPLLKKVPRH